MRANCNVVGRWSLWNDFDMSLNDCYSRQSDGAHEVDGMKEERNQINLLNRGAI